MTSVWLVEQASESQEDEGWTVLAVFTSEERARGLVDRMDRHIGPRMREVPTNELLPVPEYRLFWRKGA